MVAKEAREIIALVPVVLMRARTMAPSTGVDLITGESRARGGINGLASMIAVCRVA